MIVVTFKGAPSPLLGRVKGITVGPHVPGPSVCAAMVDALDRFRVEPDAFLFVAPGGRINSARIWPVVDRADWDVAAYVDCIGNLPKAPGVFSGVGRLSLQTLLIRPTAAGKRLLARWAERNAVRAGNEAVELAIALVETRTPFLQLPRSWVWQEEMRAMDSMAEAVVEFGGHPASVPTEVPKKAVQVQRKEEKRRDPEVLQSGHFLSWASYGRLNREVLFRIANSLTVRIEPQSEAVLVDEYTRARVDSFRETLIGPKAPVLRFFGPDYQPSPGRFAVNFTLMETERVHLDMVRKINTRFSELWTCTEWGRNAFVQSGVKIPTRVIPLGVDSVVYRPQKRRRLQDCQLISTSARGTRGTPSGFVVLVVGLPSRRKNFELIADAMEEVFPRRADVDLVVATTHAPSGWSDVFRRRLSSLKIRVWTLEGTFTDHEMSEIYSAADVVASASLGEGWFLPGHEGAACGKPIVVPRNSVHPEVFGDDAWMFDHEGMERIPEAESVSPWYVEAEWPIYRKKARQQLGELLQEVHDGGREVRERTKRLRERMVRLTWDATAAAVARRLIEVQP